MSPRVRFRPHQAIGMAVIVLFAFLLMLRLGIFKREAWESSHLPFILSSGMDREVWMTIFQKDRKIGYAHRRFHQRPEGYRIQEEVSIWIDVLGMIQEVRFRLIGDLNHRLALSTFDFELQSGFFRYRARGGVQGRTLSISSGPTGSEEFFQLPLEKEIYLPTGLLESLRTETMRIGEHRSFEVFDPLTFSLRKVKVSLLGEETIMVLHRREKAKKVSVDFMGTPQMAWIGEDGSILREEGSFGLRLERTTREGALTEGNLSASFDLAEAASVPANRILSNPLSMDLLKLRLEGIETEAFFLDGGRQSFRDGVLTIRKEELSNPSLPPEGPGRENLRDFLKPTPLIQSDHPEIVGQARAIVSSKDSDLEKGRKLVLWVHQNIRRRPVLSIPNALETLRNRVGDCNEHAVLLAALARASGLPTEVEAGLVYQDGRFYYHAWNVLHIGRWVTADATLNQFPADVTHLRLIRGIGPQIDLARAIGKIRLAILE